MSNGNASLIAGMLAGVAGLLVFLVIHHLWMRVLFSPWGQGITSRSWATRLELERASPYSLPLYW